MPLHRYKERNQTGAFIADADPFNIAYEIGKEIKVSEPGGVGHAAEMETSHMYYIHPELCNKENAIKNIQLKHPYLSHDPFVKGDTVFVPSDIAAYKEVTNHIGVVGDSTVSSAENGKIYHEQLVQNLISFVKYCDKEVEISLRNQEIPI